MKNTSLYISALIFFAMSAAQYLRYHFDVQVVVGGGHHIPSILSLYASIGILGIAILMLIAALWKN